MTVVGLKHSHRYIQVHKSKKRTWKAAFSKLIIAASIFVVILVVLIIFSPALFILLVVATATVIVPITTTVIVPIAFVIFPSHITIAATTPVILFGAIATASLLAVTSPVPGSITATVTASITSFPPSWGGSRPGARAAAPSSATIFVEDLHPGRGIIVACTPARANLPAIQLADCIIGVTGVLEFQGTFSISDVSVPWMRSSEFAREILKILPGSLLRQPFDDDSIPSSS
mmetsp:Transcript_10766/g.12789  ORF Transcript_10766/g.12789 Transcript_10766/m.12789 type:complete len:231 (-) Transcript_10766:35-727(-)